MPFSSSQALSSFLLLILPGTALAQNIPPEIAALALSPVLVLLLAIVLGAVNRSWRVGFMHSGLVLAWILLFGVASYWVENDYVIWTPIVLCGVHAAIMVILIASGMARRGK